VPVMTVCRTQASRAPGERHAACADQPPWRLKMHSQIRR